MNKFLLLLSVVVYVKCDGRLDLAQYSGLGASRPTAFEWYKPQQQRDYQQEYQQGYQQEYLPQRYEPQPRLYAQPQYKQPQVVEVQNDDEPIKVIFRARSPKIEVQQVNLPGDKPTVQHTRTEEEPHRLIHEVHRPVIQELREIIQPYRRVVQEIQPVIEQVQTIVARGDSRNGNGNAQQQDLGQQQGLGQQLVLAQPLQYDNEQVESGNQGLSYLTGLLQASRAQSLGDKYQNRGGA